MVELRAAVRRHARACGRLLGLLLLAAAKVQAQAVSLEGLLQVWYTRSSNDDLRRGRTGVAPNTYYDLRTTFTEDSFHVRRTEIKLVADVTEKVSAAIMVDPSIGLRGGDVLQDAVMIVKLTTRFELRAGQMKTLQTYEGLASSGSLLFAERGQLTRQFGDIRDRGAVAAYSFGNLRHPAVRISAGVFNGSGKAADANPHKDAVARLELRPNATHEVGLYGLLGETDQPDGRERVPLVLAGDRAPGPPAILENRDRTANLGAYWVIRRGGFEAASEVIGGLLGRRRPTLGTATGPARREHLDQRFLALQATAAYAHGSHRVALRYDRFDANAGHDHYMAHDPYTGPAEGGRQGADFTPAFKELSASYAYAFDALRPAAAKLQVTYVRRSRNFLLPPPGETGSRGGDSLVALFQVAF